MSNAPVSGYGKMQRSLLQTADAEFGGAFRNPSERNAYLEKMDAKRRSLRFYAIIFGCIFIVDYGLGRFGIVESVSIIPPALALFFYSAANHSDVCFKVIKARQDEEA